MVSGIGWMIMILIFIGGFGLVIMNWYNRNLGVGLLWTLVV